jgi:hypothetical protein
VFCDPVYNMSEAEAAEFLGISTRRLAALRRRSAAPYHVWRGKQVRYALPDLIMFYRIRSGTPLTMPPETAGDGE